MTDDANEPLIHLGPLDGESRTRCCNRIPFELLADRMTYDEAAVTCPGPMMVRPDDDQKLRGLGEVHPPARSITLTGWVVYCIDDPDGQHPYLLQDSSGYRAARPVSILPGWDARRVTITVDLP